MSPMKVAWYVLWVKNMHFGSPWDPSQTAAAEVKPRCVYSILKPHGQSFRRQIRLLPSKATPREFQTKTWVYSPPQSRSQAVVCVSTPRMYPRSGYFLVHFNWQIFLVKSIDELLRYISHFQNTPTLLDKMAMVCKQKAIVVYHK